MLTYLIAVLSFILSFSFFSIAQAETVIERVRNTQELKIGVRRDAIPFSYLKNNREWTGYSLEMINLIKQNLEHELNKPIKLNYIEVTVEERIPNIVTQKIDLICDSTSYTWNRERFVDFSVPYFLTGTQLIVQKESGLSSPQSFKEKRIGVIPQTTNETAIMENYPQAILVPVQTGEQGFKALQVNQIDAFAWDGILLKGFQKTLPNPDAFMIVPDTAYNLGGYVCTVPENNSDFLDIINYSLIKFMQGYSNNKPEDIAIFERWFGKNGFIPLNRDLILNYFRDVINFHEKTP